MPMTRGFLIIGNQLWHHQFSVLLNESGYDVNGISKIYNKNQLLRLSDSFARKEHFSRNEWLLIESITVEKANHL